MKLVVYDDEIEESGKKLADNYERVQEIISEYEDILYTLITDGIKSGAIHNSLSEFRNQVGMYSNLDGTNAGRQGEIYKTYCDSFVNDLDKADGDLY